MLLILLVCLIKLVSMSALNRNRRNIFGGFLSASSKENYNFLDENGNPKCYPNDVEEQQQEQITVEQYQKLRYYQNLQFLYQQRLQSLRQHQQQQQQQHQRKQKQQQQLQAKNQQKRKPCQIPYRKGKHPQRGMTEYPSINEKQKSHLHQLSPASPHRYISSSNQPKRPLTSPNNAYNYDFPHNFSSPQTENSYSEKATDYEDVLTEENLKKNVEIVLNNLNRYNNALRSIILNEQSLINWNNNVTPSQISANMLSSPESDFNSNPPHPFGYLNCSIASSHDFTHDNSDYQWFIDYGYRDGGVQHQSVLSSLSASYNGIGELSYYEDLARNIDANLAEVDMESFRAEDINSLLTNIPSHRKAKHRLELPELDNSICKSELLFSPVRESHISVDSLDLDSYPDDGDIILTCQANKDNYTIAFEGSAAYSDESFYAETGELYAKNKHNCINLHSNLDDIVKKKSLEVSMSRSDHAFTTWSKLKKSSTSQLQRYPSGNNNTSVNIVTRHAPHCSVRKSSSLPNLRLKKDTGHQLNVSQAVSSSTVDSFKKFRNLLPMCQMPISSTSGDSESPNQQSSMHSTADSSSKQTAANQPAFNLVKLFIKQKSSSSDTCMDVSSGCWPSDVSSSLEQRIRKKSMNDSGKGSALSRHDEEDDAADSSYQLDSLDICDANTVKNDTVNITPKKIRNDLYREVFEPSSPTHRSNRNQQPPLRNPQLLTVQIQNNNNNINNNNNSLERDSLSKDFSNKSLSDTSRTSENLTQVFYSNRSSKELKMPVDTIARSIQTSMMLKDRFRVVPPSFLAQLNKLGKQREAPVYVIYPNYALPDLGFVKTNLSDVILSPLGFKESLKNKRRPNSITSSDEETLKNVEYSHVSDWKSLVTLLPTEYRKRLKHIPEADVDIDPTCSMRPLFCMTPPLRRNVKLNACDCAQYLQQQTVCTSSSESSQPPSSGYRGSSTMLTDSEFENASQQPTSANSTDPMTNMYVYQYENTKMEGEIIERPPPSGRNPRGILRRNARSAPKGKRNSMFEEGAGNSPSGVKNLEKRRSLQEPYYWETHKIIEDYLAEVDESNSNSNQYYGNKIKRDTGNLTLDLMAIGSDKKCRTDQDMAARTRAENFLSSVPKSELKYYAEIASILESMETNHLSVENHFDSAKLKNEVSRALSQKKVSFNQPTSGNQIYLQPNDNKRFSTPPNSPNISMAGLRINNNQKRMAGERRELSIAEQEKQEKLCSNRFKRLQIQWELLSKDSSVLLKDLARENETKSGGSTPTSTGSQRSRIPRPVSYPATKTANLDQTSKNLRSPSRIVPPRKYGLPALGGVTTAVPSSPAKSCGISRPKTPSKLHNTPKKTAPSPRPATRTR